MDEWDGCEWMDDGVGGWMGWMDVCVEQVPSALTAKKALCSQMNTMMLEQWHNHGYICENFYPAKGHDGCSPGAMHFYHWGAVRSHAKAYRYPN